AYPCGAGPWRTPPAPAPIGSGQTISQPYIVPLMIEAAGIPPGGRVLEVGAGTASSGCATTPGGTAPARPARRPPCGVAQAPDGTAAGALHRRDLPSGSRAAEPLRGGGATGTVRCLGVVRPDHRGVAAHAGAARQRDAGDLAVRPVSRGFPPMAG